MRRRRHAHLPPAPQTSAHGDAGYISLILALGAVAILAVGAIVIDGGRGYFQRRSMQNAADSASMAGLRALDRAKFIGAPTVSDGSVKAAVDTEVQAHGGIVSQSRCYLTNAYGQRLTSSGECGATTVAYHRAQAYGVEVEAVSEETTFLASVVDHDTVTAKARATATMQAFTGGTGSPFIVCGKPSVNPDAYPILNPDNSLNTTGIAGMGTFAIQGSQVPGCGAGAAFKGKNNSESITVGAACAGNSPPYDGCGMAWGDNGNGFESDISVLVNTATPCTNDVTTNCDVLLPVADWASGNGNAVSAHIVSWVVVRVTGTGHGNPKYYGTINVTASQNLLPSGATAQGPITSGATPRVLKLSA